MRVDPYKLYPVPPRVGVLVDERTALVEGEGELSLDELPPDARVYGSGDLVSDLLARELGEALAWNNEPIRWRPTRGRGAWKNSSSDVLVLWLPFPAPSAALEGLRLWRDWLGDYRATPRGLGSSGFSLLRATLSEPLWTTVGEHPPIRWTIGGRQELAVSPGAYEGSLQHFDLPAAYAQTLGELRYGEWWREVDTRFPFERAHARGMAVFVRARVSIPELAFGPLCRRPRRRPGLFEALLFSDTIAYPSGCRMQGVWTWDELAAALEVGCTIEKVLTVWLHVAPEDRLPFAAWWSAVQDGRAMRHPFARLLAKATGNATWGQFAIRPDGKRDVVSYSRHGQTMRKRMRPVPVHGTRPGAPDLAELLTGKVRARLFRFMHAAGDAFLSAHTDGAWVRELDSRPEGWRLDERATRLELLGPQTLRYWRPGESEPVYVVAGVPERLAPDYFGRAWSELEVAA